MSINEEGRDAEKRARILLKDWGYQVQQADWLAKKDNEWVVIEVKSRELFEPPPFLGTGLDKNQVYLRSQLLNDLGLRTILIVFQKHTNFVYYQFLDILESGEKFITKNQIHIYPIENFNKSYCNAEKSGQTF